jgi:hypothetical protein
MSRRIALITTLLVLAVAAPARAQSDAFGPLPPTETATPVPTAAVTDSTDQNNTNRNTLFIIGGLLVVGFGAMGWFIMRDARSALPEDERLELSRSRDEGPHAHRLKAKSKARSKGRAQRNARKSNRPR